MGSDKWTAKIERGAERQLESLPHSDLVKEAAEIIDDLAHDPVPSGAVAMRGYNKRLCRVFWPGIFHTLHDSHAGQNQHKYHDPVGGDMH